VKATKLSASSAFEPRRLYGAKPSPLVKKTGMLRALDSPMLLSEPAWVLQRLLSVQGSLAECRC
jgi:hypothetical protein